MSNAFQDSAQNWGSSGTFCSGRPSALACWTDCGRREFVLGLTQILLLFFYRTAEDSAIWRARR